MPEETKPTRNEFEKWLDSLPECSETCEGDLIGSRHDAHCPLYGIGFATHKDAFYAGQDAALERAAGLAFKLRSHQGGFKWVDAAAEIRDAILALKGSR